MAEEVKDKVEEAGKALEDMTNRFGSHEDLAALADKMAYMHRTLVQSFTSGFVIPFVRTLAQMKRNERYDARDKSAVDMCDLMWSALEKEYEVGETDEFRLPMI